MYLGGKLSPWFGTDPVTITLRNMARLGVRRGKELTVDKTPVETGDLKASWQESDIHRVAGLLFVGDGYGAEWYTEVNYAAYVEHGTGLWGPEHREYLILPKHPGGTLHWVGPDGVDVYAKSVLHPGSPGAHMVADAAAVLEVTLEPTLRPALKDWARETERQNPYAVGV